MLTDQLLKEIHFPYDKIREVQSDMISDVYNAIKDKKHIIMHAPTGIGKTVSALAPALHHSMKNNLTVFFLTSRQTQHKIVVDTLRQIKQKFGIDVECADIIGKKWMCLQSQVEIMGAGSFHEYCSNLRKERHCEFYINTRKDTLEPTVNAKLALEELKTIGPCHVHDFINEGKTKKMCPYELAALTASNANVIIADYYYVFNHGIREGFLQKIKKDLRNIILVIDEAHNLPKRLREMLTQNTSSQSIENAKREARKFGYEETAQALEIVENSLFELAKDIDMKTQFGSSSAGNECIISKASLVDSIGKGKEYGQLMSELYFIGKEIMDQQKMSYVLSVAKFLEAWLGSDIGFGRILSKSMENKLAVNLSYRCLDPSLAAKEVINRSHCTIMMSGTLTPTSMYRDILGFDETCIEKEYRSPFPKKNRLNLVIPKTTTKFVERDYKQYGSIAKVCSEITNAVNGNSAVFFPSYDLMQNIAEHFKKETSKPVFLEKQKMTKKEKEDLIESFKSYKDKGAVLFGNSTGSFGEGIDMPNVLKAVIIVGLPLNKPDTEARLLIEYYDDKFNRGFEYGYVLPAITKCMQNAGRCIRSETDKGAIIFLDERYAWKNYYDCFPPDWDIEVEMDYMDVLKEFFEKQNLNW